MLFSIKLSVNAIWLDPHQTTNLIDGDFAIGVNNQSQPYGFGAALTKLSS
jgi:hypothetical protein